MASLLSYALVGLSDVKETLGIASSVTTYDNLITRKINQATEMIVGYCNRRFDEQTNVVEYYDGTYSQQLLLRNRPVTDTTTFSLQARNTSLNDVDFTTIPSNEYFVDTAAGVVDGVSSFSGSYDRFKVTYSYGWATIPSDIAEACATVAAFLVNNDPSQNAGISQKEEGTRKITYSSNKNGYDSENLIDQLGLKITLDRYAEPIISGQR